MKLTKLIARRIEKKLGYTNGWAIDSDKYTKLCEEVAEEILDLQVKLALKKARKLRGTR